jgi:hypothetical protein
MSRHIYLRWLAALVDMFILCGWTAPTHAESWTELHEVDGIKVYSRTDEGRSCYKASGDIQANLFELMAVIADLPRRSEWVRNLKVSKAIEGDISSSVLLYEKYDFPWPAMNRDTVTRSMTRIDYRTLEIEANFHHASHPEYPEERGVIRIPFIKGWQLFKYASVTTTHTENSICIDIGGQIPSWLVRMVSKDMPSATILDLQRQVAKTRGQYKNFVETHQQMARQAGSLAE